MKINQDFKHFIIIILVATILASIFGALHNQISFSISKEFFKDFLFGNFNAYDWNIKNERVLATIVGIIGTWWFGLILGIIYIGMLAVSCNFPHHKHPCLIKCIK